VGRKIAEFGMSNLNFPNGGVITLHLFFDHENDINPMVTPRVNNVNARVPIGMAIEVAAGW
jgi:hypothetical protein